MYKKQYQLLDQLIEEAKKGLDFVVYRMKVTGRMNGNAHFEVHDCRAVNDGRFKYMKTRSEAFIEKHDIVFRE